jgi:hypothetical protein
VDSTELSKDRKDRTFANRMVMNLQVRLEVELP